ncbi:sugar transferase [Solibaculum mannosilyticum]|uniref:UDP-phosphate galactose phosphotransferase n=1 Tax=Solibaculum mannosilyticum TaxID=2780922 RepID=A0A7I8D4M0_9FIRM|nr:sugar transferase [Solibaculum mannosilyticum]BCI60985.1 UDP-phosphate galactose phosphotransferase [Solibaculum mannosilyticum]CZT55491.1 UDP-glucose:undecaprenyl-phosphate glucose-1-phosphate transferase [Eubacteriaceae bacterium CHKCI005]
MRIYPAVKRVLDIVLSSLALILLSPVLLILAVAIKVDSSGPVFLRQKRMGRYKKEFVIFKFRTMRADTPRYVPTHLLDNPDQYITRVGRFLRKTSLDELPQLLNIVRGNMSIIGPRPVIKNEFDLIELRDKYGANDIRPGLTGWAQINGRDDLPNDVKAAYDGEYAQNLSFAFDMKVFFKSFSYVAKGSGNREGEKVVSEFRRNA